MKIGTAIRNMGPAATREIMRRAAEQAEAAGLAHIWTVDHIAIPPDDAEGSEGRWIDPLTALAYFAAATETIELGVSVLVLPYRAALPTAKWIASIQELSGGRLHFGIGPGWMEPEFKALGVRKNQRGKITDETIDFILRCFHAKDDIVELNGQSFLFRPRPACPPIYVGGMTDVALARTIRVGDGWLPIGLDAEKLEPRYQKLAQMAEQAGRSCPEMVLIGSLPESQDEAVETLGRCKAIGASHYIQASRYETADEIEAMITRLADLSRQLS